MIREWFDVWRQRRARVALVRDAEKAQVAIDIMLDGQKWYGGCGVVVEEGKLPRVEVLIVDAFPGKLSAFVPPNIGAIPVLVRFGTPKEN